MSILTYIGLYRGRGHHDDCHRGRGLTMDYKGKVCVVTGATSGNGQAVAYELLRQRAKVYALGRNREKLRFLQAAGAKVLRMDLGDNESIDQALIALPDHIDYVFHLAGNALLGNPNDDEIAAFWQTDYYGPVRLLEGLAPRLFDRGGMGVVTSASAHLPSISHVRHYQQVKSAMVDWWANRLSRFQEHGHGLTLISMGVIDTGIWGKTLHLPRLTRTLVHLVIPGPEKYTTQILQDVAHHAAVSYPGVAAEYLPVEGAPEVLVKAAAAAIQTWFWMFGGSTPTSRA